MKLWIAGKRIGEWREGSWIDTNPWELVGVFSSEELAAAACHDTTHFVGSLELDEEAPAETTAFPDFRYPRE